MKRIKSRAFVLPAVLVMLLFLPHVLFLQNNYVDLERVYVSAARQIADHGFAADLSNYFSNVANPVFTLIMLAGSYKIFGESILVSRLTILVLSFGFSLFLYFFLKSRMGRGTSFVATLFVIVNPAFIVYSQYVHTDLPFMAFSSASLLLLIFVYSARGKILSSIILGLSLATKYVTVVIFPVAFLYALFKYNILARFSKGRLVSFAWFNIWYFGLAVLLSLPIISVVFNFRSSGAPPYYEVALAPSASMFLPRLIAYMMLLGLFVGPSVAIVATDLWLKVGRSRFLALLAALVLFTALAAVFYPVPSWHRQEGYFGEMNLGWVELTFPPALVSAALFLVVLAAELFVTNILFDLLHSKEEVTKTLFFWIVLPVLSMSLTRVANRYLLVILVPLSLYTAMIVERMYSRGQKLFVVSTVVAHALMFLVAGVYSNYYLFQRGIFG